jgi:hypothetical protein
MGGGKKRKTDEEETVVEKRRRSRRRRRGGEHWITRFIVIRRKEPIVGRKTKLLLDPHLSGPWTRPIDRWRILL